jgi:hypothetical protein
LLNREEETIWPVSVSATFDFAAPKWNDFEDGPLLFTAAAWPHSRHVGLQPRANRLHVFFTERGGAPEHIRMAEVNMDVPWTSWRVGTAVEIMRPQTACEGANEPITTSKKGPARNPEHALRPVHLSRVRLGLSTRLLVKADWL